MANTTVAAAIHSASTPPSHELPVEFLQRHIGQIGTEEMMRRLSSFEQWVPRVMDPVDGVLPGGSEEELESLLDDGFLTEQELDRIVAVHE